jgi:hypothetical protein
MLHQFEVIVGSYPLHQSVIFVWIQSGFHPIILLNSSVVPRNSNLAPPANKAGLSASFEPRAPRDRRNVLFRHAFPSYPAECHPKIPQSNSKAKSKRAGDLYQHEARLRIEEKGYFDVMNLDKDSGATFIRRQVVHAESGVSPHHRANDHQGCS